jgi:hypothetical protein
VKMERQVTLMRGPRMCKQRDCSDKESESHG